MIKSVGGYQVEMIEPPSLGKRVAPSMLVMVPGGAFVGIVVGFLLAVWAHQRARARAA
jgi:uncharacterized protein involved in exopolysaccharide biosynthesis